MRQFLTLILIVVILFILYLHYVMDIENFDNENNQNNYCSTDNPDITPNKRFVSKENIDAINNYPESPFFIDALTTSTFKPECCPSTYTTSHGCLCYEPKNYGLIVTRGGNRVIIPP